MFALLQRWLFRSSDEGVPFAALQQRLRRLKWWIPAALIVIVAIYELGPARWIHDQFGTDMHFIAEIVVYGTIGPTLMYVLIEVLTRWLEERAAAEQRARMLAQAHEHVAISRQLNDDAIQTLFAASILLDSVEARLPDRSPETTAQLQAARQALDQTIQQIRLHLLHQPLSPPAAQPPSRPAPHSSAERSECGRGASTTGDGLPPR